MALATLTPAQRSPSSVERTARTRQDGTYELRDVPPGDYTLSFSRARYVTTPWRREGRTGAATRLDVRAGADMSRMDAALTRAAAIAGRLTDELGDPLENAWVVAARRGFDEHGPTFVTAAVGVTNDIGVYRISHLQPGDYYILAAERGESFGSSPDADIGFARTAYPGTADIRHARLVTVATGQDLTGIDFALIPAPLGRIEGHILASNGLAAANVRLMLQAIGNGPGTGVGGEVRTGSDGSFAFPNVLTGRYELHARLNRQPNEGAVIPVTVAGDVLNWNITLTPGGRISGRVVLPEGATTIKPDGMRVLASPAGETFIFGAGVVATVQPDWTFEETFLIGRRVLRVDGLPPGWYVKSIKRGLDDLTDTTFMFTRDEVIDNLEVHIAPGAPTVSGSAVGTDGARLTQYSVVVFSEDDERWGPYSRYVVSVAADDKGQFKVTSLPPGRYLIAGVLDLLPYQWVDRAFLQSLRSGATDIVLEPDRTTAVTIRVAR
jgi:hypothetical protein